MQELKNRRTPDFLKDGRNISLDQWPDGSPVVWPSETEWSAIYGLQKVCTDTIYLDIKRYQWPDGIPIVWPSEKEWSVIYGQQLQCTDTIYRDIRRYYQTTETLISCVCEKESKSGRHSDFVRKLTHKKNTISSRIVSPPLRDDMSTTAEVPCWPSPWSMSDRRPLLSSEDNNCRPDTGDIEAPPNILHKATHVRRQNMRREEAGDASDSSFSDKAKLVPDVKDKNTKGWKKFKKILNLLRGK